MNIKLMLKLIIAMSPFLMGAGGGCGGDTEPPPRPLKVVIDNYCLMTKPQSWSPKDTTETIDGVRQSEAVRVCRCVKPKPKACG